MAEKRPVLYCLSMTRMLVMAHDNGMDIGMTYDKKQRAIIVLVLFFSAQEC